MISLSVPMIAGAADDRIIEQGEEAPFLGILVPESNYREYQKQYERALLLEKERLAFNHACENDSWTVVVAVSLITFGVGAYLGAKAHQQILPNH